MDVNWLPASEWHTSPSRRVPLDHRAISRASRDHVGAHVRRHPPAHDGAGEGVDDEADVDRAWPGGDVGQIHDPRGVGSGGAELSIDQVRWPGAGGVGPGGEDLPTATDTANAQLTHEAGDLVPADALASSGRRLRQLRAP
jgi:hypothetical protein